MLGRVFPGSIDNTWRGSRLALWLLAPLAFVKLMMGLNMMLNTRKVLAGADAVPLDSYGAAAAGQIVDSTQAWALCLFLLAALAFLALVRYRAMVPLVYLVLLVENAGRMALHGANPFGILTGAARPSFALTFNLALIVLLIVGFLLSLGGRRKDV